MSIYIANRVARALESQPVFLAPASCVGRDGNPSEVAQVLAALRAGEPVDHGGLAADLAAAYGGDGLSEKPFVFVQGVAIVPAHGMLINRFLGSYGYVTGYEFIQQKTALADADPDVKAIVYDVHSGGGLVAGAQETWDAIRAAKKPTIAVVDTAAFSAAYYIASAADRIVATPSAEVGSIGVYRIRADFTKALADDGVKIDIIHAGAQKLDGHPFTEMDDEERARHQASVDAHYETFVQAVATGRGLSADDVRATEAGCFSAQEGLRLGLVNDIMTATAALGAVLMTGTRMSAPDLAALAAEARAAEKVRITAIQSAPAAKNRPKLAAHLALETDLSAEQATAILAAAETDATPAVAAQQAEVDPLDAAMRRYADPDVGDDGGKEKQMTAAQRILAAHSAATGIQYKQ